MGLQQEVTASHACDMLYVQDDMNVDVHQEGTVFVTDVNLVGGMGPELDSTSPIFHQVCSMAGVQCALPGLG